MDVRANAEADAVLVQQLAALQDDIEFLERANIGGETMSPADQQRVRDLGTREDVPGKPIQLTIDAALQDYAARRIGLESAAVVVIDCDTGGILALCSMPAFDARGPSCTRYHQYRSRTRSCRRSRAGAGCGGPVPGPATASTRMA